jgi:hypothetical protein
VRRPSSESRAQRWRHLALALLVFATAQGHAEGLRPLNVGVRGGADGPNIFGGDEDEHFVQVEAFATWRLPWTLWSGSLWSDSDWDLAPRVVASGGMLEGGGDEAFVGTVAPLLALGAVDFPLALDAGVGLAVMSRYELGRQDFGGPVQIVLTFGLRVPVYRGFAVGYRMQHLSDATLYDDGTGIDAHMLELSYTLW